MQIKDVERIVDTLPITERRLSVELNTRATWLTLPAALRERFEAEFWPRWETNGAETDSVSVGPSFQDALHSALHAILKAFPEIVLCDDSEIDGISQPPFAGGSESLLLYDNFPGGLGLVEEFFVTPEPVLQRALEIVEGCTCTYDEGCPVCISRYGCRSFNQGLSKLAAQYLLRSLLSETTTRVIKDLQDLVDATVSVKRIVPSREAWEKRLRQEMEA